MSYVFCMQVYNALSMELPIKFNSEEGVPWYWLFGAGNQTRQGPSTKQTETNVGGEGPGYMIQIYLPKEDCLSYYGSWVAPGNGYVDILQSRVQWKTRGKRRKSRGGGTNEKEEQKKEKRKRRCMKKRRCMVSRPDIGKIPESIGRVATRPQRCA